MVLDDIQRVMLRLCVCTAIEQCHVMAWCDMSLHDVIRKLYIHIHIYI